MLIPAGYAITEKDVEGPSVMMYLVIGVNAAILRAFFLSTQRFLHVLDVIACLHDDGVNQ